MQRTALVCLLLAGTFAAVHGAAKAPAAKVAAPIVCASGEASTHDELALFNTSLRSYMLAPALMAAVEPTFNGTVFVPSDKAFNQTLFDLFLTPINFTGPLPVGASALRLLRDYIKDIAKFHIIPNTILDPSAVTTFDADGIADFGPYPSALTAANQSPAMKALCKTDVAYDATTFGKDILVEVSTTQPTTISCAGASASVNATKITCGGAIHAIDVGALFPCYPDITMPELAPLVAQMLADIKSANETYLASFKKSAAPMTGAHAMLTVAVSCIALVAVVFGM